MEDLSIKSSSESETASAPTALQFAQDDCIDLTSAPGGPNWDDSASVMSFTDALQDHVPAEHCAPEEEVEAVVSESGSTEEDVGASAIGNVLDKSIGSVARELAVVLGAGGRLSEGGEPKEDVTCEVVASKMDEPPAQGGVEGGDDAPNPSAARFAQLFDLDPEAAGEVSATFDRSEWLFGDSESERGREAGNDVTRIIPSGRPPSPIGWRGDPEPSGFAMLVFDSSLSDAGQPPATGEDEGRLQREGMIDDDEQSAPSSARFAQLFDLDPEAAGEVSATIDPSDWLLADGKTESEYQRCDGGASDGLWPDEMVLLSFTPVDELMSEAAVEEVAPTQESQQQTVVVEEQAEVTTVEGALVCEESDGGDPIDTVLEQVDQVISAKQQKESEDTKVECEETVKTSGDEISQIDEEPKEENCVEAAIDQIGETCEAGIVSEKITCVDEPAVEASEAVASADDDSSTSAPSAARFAQLVDLDPEAAGEVSATIDRGDWYGGESGAESEHGSGKGDQFGFGNRVDSIGWPDEFADDGFAMLVLDAPLVSMSDVNLTASGSGRSSQLSEHGQKNDDSGDAAPSRARFAQLMDLDMKAADEMSTTVDPSEWIFSDTDAESGEEVSPHGVGMDLNQPGLDEYVTLSCTLIDEHEEQTVVVPEADVKDAVVNEEQPVEVAASETANSVSSEAAPSAAQFSQLDDLDMEAASEVSATVDRSDWLFGDSEAESKQTESIENEQMASVTPPEWTGEVTEVESAMVDLDGPLVSSIETKEDIAVSSSPAEMVVMIEKDVDNKEVMNPVDDDSNSAAPKAARFAQLIDLDPEAAGEVSATLDQSDWLFGDSDGLSGRQSAQSQRRESYYPVNHAGDDVVTLNLIPVEGKGQSVASPSEGTFVSLRNAMPTAGASKMTASVEEEIEPSSMSGARFVQLMDLDEEAAVDLSSAPYHEDFDRPEPNFFGFGDAVTLVFAPPVEPITPSFVEAPSMLPVGEILATTTTTVPVNESVSTGENAAPDRMAWAAPEEVNENANGSVVAVWPVPEEIEQNVNTVNQSATADVNQQPIVPESQAFELPSETGELPNAMTSMPATVIIEPIDVEEATVDGESEVSTIPDELSEGFASLVFEVSDAKAPISIPREVPTVKEVTTRPLPFSVEGSVAALVSAIAEQSKPTATDSETTSNASSVSADHCVQLTDLETPRVASASEGSLTADARYLQGDDLDGRGMPGMMSDSSSPDSGAMTLREFEPQQVVPGSVDEHRVRNPRRGGGRLRRTAAPRPAQTDSSETQHDDSLAASQGWEGRGRTSIREPGSMRIVVGRPNVPSPRRQRAPVPVSQPSLASRFLAGSQVTCDDPEALAATVWELEDRLETSTGGARIGDSARTERAVEVARAQLMDSLNRQGQERRHAEVLARSTCSRTEVEEFQRMMAQREQQLESRLREQVQQLREKQSKEMAEQEAQLMLEPKQRLFSRTSQKGRVLRLQRQMLMSSHKSDSSAQASTIGDRLAQTEGAELNAASSTGVEAARAQLEQKHKDEMDDLLQACDVRRGEFRFLKETLARRFTNRSSTFKPDDQNGTEPERLWTRSSRKDSDSATGLTSGPRRKLMVGKMPSASKTPSVGEFNALPLPPLAKEATASRRRNKVGASGKA
jgi:hypothetical protein